jgi:hypothetical protein
MAISRRIHRCQADLRKMKSFIRAARFSGVSMRHGEVGDFPDTDAYFSPILQELILSVPVPDTREDLAVGSQTELFWAYNSGTAAQAKQSTNKLKEKRSTILRRYLG